MHQPIVVALLLFALMGEMLLNPARSVARVVDSSDFRAMIGLARSEEPRRTLSLTEVRELAASNSYDSRLAAQRVLQARHAINIAIGRFLPSLNFAVAFNIGYLGYVNIAALSLGFLFPSNWFRWRESTLFFRAERHSFAALLGNEVYEIELLFYRIAMMKAAAKVYAEFIDRVNDVIAKAETLITDPFRRAQPLGEIRNYKLALQTDLGLLMKSTEQLHAQFWFALGIEPETWREYTLADYEFPNTGQWQPIADVDGLYNDVYELAEELKAFDDLYRAAQFAMFSRGFDFMMPGIHPDSSLGFGTYSSIQIGRSQRNEFGIRKKEAAAHIRSALEQSVIDHNISIIAYDKLQERYENGKQLFDFLYQRLVTEPYIDDNIVDAMNFMVQGKIGQIQVQLLGVNQEALIRRYLWNDAVYQHILEVARSKKPDKHINMWQKLENMRIARAEERGRLEAMVPD